MQQMYTDSGNELASRNCCFWLPTLFDQSLVRILQRDFPSMQFLLVDIPIRGNSSVATGLGRRREADPHGFTMKPFTRRSRVLQALKFRWQSTGVLASRKDTGEWIYPMRSPDPATPISCK